MATLAIAAAGAYLAPAGYAAIGWTIGAALGQKFFSDDVDISTQGPRLTDLSVQASTDGAPILKIYGTNRVAGNVIWSTDLIETQQTESQDVGKGGGGGSVSQTSYKYSVSFAVGLCEGEILGVRKIFADGKLLYDMEDQGSLTDSQVIAMTLKSVSRSDAIRIYTGSETQTEDPLIEATEGTTPAYRGIAYVVFENLELMDYGNRIPNITAEVVVGGSKSYVTVSGFDIQGYDGAFPNAYTSSSAANISSDGNFTVFQGNWDGAYSSNEVFVYEIVDGYPALTSTFTAQNNDGFYIGRSDIPCFINKHASLANHLYFYYQDGSYIKIIIPESLGVDHGRFAKDQDEIFLGSNNFGSKIIYKIDFPNGSITAVSSALSQYAASIDVSADYVYVLAAISGSPGEIYKLNRSDLSLSSTISLTANTHGQKAGIKVFDDNLIYVYSSTTFIEIRDGVETSSTLTAEFIENSNFDVNESVIYLHNISKGKSIVESKIIYNSIPSNSYTLSDIVDDICQDAGLSASDIDVTALTDSVNGYAITHPMAGRSAIEPLQRAFWFDAVESDGKIKFVKRGGSSVLTITEDDLIGGDALITTRAQEQELPVNVDLLYLATSADYQQGMQTSRRITTNSKKNEVITLPIAMSDNKARQISEVLHEDVWRARSEYSFSLPMKYGYLEPTDPIIIPYNNSTHFVRIITMNYIDGAIKFTALSEDAAVYTNTATGAEIATTSQLLNAEGPTALVLLDIPALRSTENEPGFYIAMAGYLSGWRGAVLYISTDSGEVWNTLTATTTAATIGKATDTLTTGIETIFDYSDSLNIDMINGTLSSATEAAIFNGSNAAAYGIDGRWEIIQFKTATLEGDGTYTITGLLRGLYGTGWAMNQHAIDDWFVILDPTTLLHIDRDSGTIGTNYLYKAISIGNSISTSGNTAFSHNEAMRPLHVAHLKQQKQSNGDIEIEWKASARTDFNMRDGVGVSVDSNTDLWRVDIMSGSTIKRTFTPATQSQTYTSAQQVTDFGSGQNTVRIRLYEHNNIVGYGYGVQLDTDLTISYIDPV